MSLDAKKLNLIERFMKLKHERSILRLEALITELELNSRARSSESDIEQGEFRAYEDFSNEVNQWLKGKSTNS